MGSINFVKELLNNRADIETKNNLGFTALILGRFIVNDL